MIKTFLFASAVSILLCSGSEADDECGHGDCCCGFVDSLGRTCYVCTQESRNECENIYKGSCRVRDEKRDRIELGYVPGSIARGLIMPLIRV